MKTKYLCFILLSFFVLTTGITGCRSRLVPLTPTTETETTTDTKEVIRDTVFETKPDSSFYKALVECQNGKVVIKKVVAQEAGKHLNKPKVTITDNVLTADCTAEAQKLFIQWKDKYISTYKTKTEKIPYPVEQELSTWQTIQIWCGRIAMVWLLFIIACAFLSIKNPLKK